MHIQSFVRREAKVRSAGRRRIITCIFSNNGNNLKYAVFFANEGKSNTSFRTVKGLLLFVRTHNINSE